MRSVHPGEVLREEFLVHPGMSAHALAMELRVPAPRINEIKIGSKIAAEVHMRLAA